MMMILFCILLLAGGLAYWFFIRKTDEPTLSAGSKCTAGGTPCLSGYSCISGKCTANPLASGATCTTSGTPCVTGYSCVSGKCTANPLAAGSSCTTGGTPCADGSSCQSGTCKPITTAPTTVPAPVGTSQSSGAAVGSWISQGCYNDNNVNDAPWTSRVIPNQLGVVTDVQSCENMALNAGYNIIGLQAGGQCFAGNNLDYAVAGPVDSCPPLGGDWTNQVYTYSTGSTRDGSG